MATLPAPTRAARRRPFGVLVICGLLVVESAILALGAVGLLLSAGPTEIVSIPVRAFGIDVVLRSDAETAARLMAAGLIALIAFTLLQVALLFALRRLGWVLTMLLAGTSLFIELCSVWRGAPTNEISLLLHALVALYLNQSDVRRAFGIGVGRTDAVGGSVDRSFGHQP